MPMKDGMPIPYNEGGSFDAEITDKEVSDQVKREFIMDVFRVGESTVMDLGRADLNTSYRKALKDSGRSPLGRNMGGMVEDELGYMGGGVSYSDRGPIKYSKGGAVSGKNFKGSF